VIRTITIKREFGAEGTDKILDLDARGAVQQLMHGAEESR
jgi:hypothetical protein